jgi:hypothetical protein
MTFCTDEDLLRDILGSPPWATQDEVIRRRFTIERSTGLDAFELEPGIGQAGDPVSDFDLGLGEIDGSEGSLTDEEWLDRIDGASDHELGFDPYAGQVLDDDPIDPYEPDWHELGGEG